MVLGLQETQGRAIFCPHTGLWKSLVVSESKVGRNEGMKNIVICLSLSHPLSPPPHPYTHSFSFSIHHSVPLLPSSLPPYLPLSLPFLLHCTYTYRFHAGSIAFGALIIAVVQLMRVILAYIQKKLKGKTGKVAEVLLCLLQCCLWCFEKILRYINRQAYIEVYTCTYMCP